MKSQSNKSMKITLSPYTMATNCTDITDCNDGISELWDACDRYKAAGRKVPEYIYKRIEKLHAKRDKCSLKEHGMKYDEWLLSRFDKLEGASDGYIEAYKEALKKWLKYQNYKGDKRTTVYHILRDNADSAREFLWQTPDCLPNIMKIGDWYFDEDITDYDTMAERIFGGLQGSEQPDEPFGTKNKKVIVNGEPITIRYRGYPTGEPYNVRKLRYGQSFDQDFLVFIDGKTYTAVRHWTNNGGGYTERWTYNGISVSSEKKLAELILSMQDNGLQGTKKTATALTVTVIKSSAFKTLSETFKRRSTTTKPRLASYPINGLSATANLKHYIDVAKLKALIADFKIDNAEDFIKAIGKCFPQQVEKERFAEEYNKTHSDKIVLSKSKYQLVDFPEFGVTILLRVSDHNVDCSKIKEDIEEAYSLAFKERKSKNDFKPTNVTATEYVYFLENCDRDKYKRIAQNFLRLLETSKWDEDYVKADKTNFSPEWRNNPAPLQGLQGETAVFEKIFSDKTLLTDFLTEVARANKNIADKKLEWKGLYDEPYYCTLDIGANLEGDSVPDGTYESFYPKRNKTVNQLSLHIKGYRGHGTNRGIFSYDWILPIDKLLTDDGKTILYRADNYYIGKDFTRKDLIETLAENDSAVEIANKIMATTDHDRKRKLLKLKAKAIKMKLELIKI